MSCSPTVRTSGPKCNITAKADVLRLSDFQRVTGDFSKIKQQNEHFVAFCEVHKKAPPNLAEPSELAFSWSDSEQVGDCGVDGPANLLIARDRVQGRGCNVLVAEGLLDDGEMHILRYQGEPEGVFQAMRMLPIRR